MKRWPKLKATMADPSADGQITLSKCAHRKREEGMNPTVTWKYLETNVPDFNPITHAPVKNSRSF